MRILFYFPDAIAEECCCFLQISEEQDMPEQICEKCLSDLTVAYRFRTNGESSHAILLSLMSKTQNEYSIEEIVKEEPQEDIDDIILVEEEDVLGRSEENVAELELDDLLVEQLPEDAHIFEAAKKAAWGDDADAQQEEIDNLEKGILVQGYKPVRQVSSVKKRMQEEAKEQLQAGDEKHRIEKIYKKVTPDGAKAVIAIRPPAKLKARKTCEICGNTYKYQHALDGHMRRHRNEKPFACQVCGRAFVIAFELRRHMRIHTGDKPYACRWCDRRFSDFGSRIKHERTHTGERPYVCTYCGKAFAYSHVLSSHIMIHTGEKRYQCEVCEKKFTKGHHLKAHMNIHLRAKGEPVPKKPRKVIQQKSPVKFEEATVQQFVVYMKNPEEEQTEVEHSAESEEAQQILIIQEN